MTAGRPSLMRWRDVTVEAIGYLLPEEVVATARLETELRSVHEALHLADGQVEALTGIRERRVWPRGTSMSAVAAVAAERALEKAGLTGGDVGAVVYAGVCRDNLEPATACAVADAIGARGDAVIFDVSNACLGVLNGMVDIANRIELGQIRAGVVVAAESSRDIVESTVLRMRAEPTMDRYRLGLATLTGGSGAVAVVLTHKDASFSDRRLVAGAALAAPEFHRICRWGPARGLLGEAASIMDTDASLVLEHGVALGRATWERFLRATDWRASDVDRVICHQVGAAHRREVLSALAIDPACDYSTFETLGNIGTVSVPITAALADEAGFLRKGDRVAMLGIGSGLNCLMLGVEW
jgi:3-oxoacyl-[acyl-carrier-protein] synthase-3